MLVVLVLGMLAQVLALVLVLFMGLRMLLLALVLEVNDDVLVLKYLDDLRARAKLSGVAAAEPLGAAAPALSPAPLMAVEAPLVDDSWADAALASGPRKCLRPHTCDESASSSVAAPPLAKAARQSAVAGAQSAPTLTEAEELVRFKKAMDFFVSGKMQILEGVRACWAALVASTSSLDAD